jgi:hypothetical protein
MKCICMVWFGTVWYGLVWFGLFVPCEITYNRRIYRKKISESRKYACIKKCLNSLNENQAFRYSRSLSRSVIIVRYFRSVILVHYSIISSYYGVYILYYNAVSHLPQNGSTGEMPLNSLLPNSFSMTASMVTSVEEYALIKVGIIGTSSK